MEYLLMFVPAIIGIAALVVFLLMAVALNNISRNTRNIHRILAAWSKETGIGLLTPCKSCKKLVSGKPAECPHCGATIEW